MPHVDGLPDDDDAGPAMAGRILQDKEAHASALMRESRKPSNWWAFEREPWKRVNAEIMAREKAAADRERADRAPKCAFAFAGAALAMVRAPAFAPGSGDE
jgi:hypothetical protein